MRRGASWPPGRERGRTVALAKAILGARMHRAMSCRATLWSQGTPMSANETFRGGRRSSTLSGFPARRKSFISSARNAVPDETSVSALRRASWRQEVRLLPAGLAAWRLRELSETAPGLRPNCCHVNGAYLLASLPAVFTELYLCSSSCSENNPRFVRASSKMHRLPRLCSAGSRPSSSSPAKGFSRIRGSPGDPAHELQPAADEQSGDGRNYSGWKSGRP